MARGRIIRVGGRIPAEADNNPCHNSLDDRILSLILPLPASSNGRESFPLPR